MKIYYREDIEKDVRQKLKKVTQTELAKSLGIHKSVLSRFLKGKDGLDVIAKGLGYEMVKGFYKRKEDKTND